MRLSELADYAAAGRPLRFHLPDGGRVPAHFHVTELGVASRHFVDCGGAVRESRAASLQLWTSVDLHHRLTGDKLAGIVATARERLDLIDDLEVEVELQGRDTIARYGLAADEDGLLLVGLHTDCLAAESCGVPGAAPAARVTRGAREASANCCSPAGGCC